MAVLLVLVVGGVLAWLALSADKPPGRSGSDVDATVTVDLKGKEHGQDRPRARAPRGVTLLPAR